MKIVYCVEDDSDIRELIEYTLTSMNFEVHGFECGADFFKAISSKMPDIVLLDIMLPDMDGMEILAKIRNSARTQDLPVIMLTAKAGQLDKIKGLDSGADDYITKPFDIIELLSRINAILRRSGISRKASAKVFGAISMDDSARIVTVDGKNVSLTYKEFELLKLFISSPEVVFTRERIMQEVWDTDFEGETRTVDVHIRTLRQKLGQCGEYIETIRNIGYKLKRINKEN